jgi:hypothetical protein
MTAILASELTEYPKLQLAFILMIALIDKLEKKNANSPQSLNR